MYSYRRRKDDYTAFYAILIILFFGIFFVAKFFVEVFKHKLWKECFVSLSLLVSTNLLLYAISTLTNIKVFVWGCVITILIFCKYWADKLGYHNLLLNSSLWQEEQYWRSMDPYQFEEEIAKLFSALGYTTKVTPKSQDYGVDVIADDNNGNKIAIQCKRYNANKVSCKDVRDLWGAKDYFNATSVIMVALDGLTANAYQFVQQFPQYGVWTIKDIIYYSKQVNVQITS